MPFNALRISNEIEKVTVDFSSYESLKKSTGFSRAYTIHTEKTNTLLNKLGFHVGGFCDENGSGGSSLACQVTGYDDLPSDVILCLMDEKYNFLPLDEEQLESLYVYLTTGEILRPYGLESDNPALAFFKHHAIHPSLPPIEDEPDAIFDDLYPDFICLRYDMSSFSDAELANLGREMFFYSDHLVNDYQNKDGFLLSPDGSHYIELKYEPAFGMWLIVIQALEQKGQKADKKGFEQLLLRGVIRF